MVVIIKKDNDKNLNLKIITMFIVLIIIAIVLLLLWIYVFNPLIKSINGQDSSGGVKCLTPPGIPIGLQTTISENILIVYWNSNKITDSYKLYLSNVDGFNLGGANKIIETKNTKTTITNLLPGTYFLRLTAINSCGESNPTAQVSTNIILWPEKIKICNAEFSNLCLIVPNIASQNARVSLLCPNNQCELTYFNENSISLSPGGTFCLEESPGGGNPLEEIVQVQNCTGGSEQEWSIDLSTGYISSASNFCLGADQVPESLVYNTSCNSINPTDNKYKWEVYPI